MWFPRMDGMVEERLRDCHLCQAATDTVQKEPIHPTVMPTQAWNTLCTDLFGPLPTGEYLVLVQCLQSRFPEVAITHSTSAAAVIPALDKILAAYGTPQEMCSDNGPPFNSIEFAKFARKLGFKHRKITPLAPWANGTAERFMKNLAKVVQIARADQKNWRHELTKYLRAYRATPHTMTGVPPATLMFNGRKYATNLPSLPNQLPPTAVQTKAESADSINKSKMKTRADSKRNVKVPSIKTGDQVLLRQKKVNKFSTPYEVEPYTVEQVKGSQITATNSIHQVTRHVNLFKRLRSREEEEEEEESEYPEEVTSTADQEEPPQGHQEESPLQGDPEEEVPVTGSRSRTPEHSRPPAQAQRELRPRENLVRPARYRGPEWGQ